MSEFLENWLRMAGPGNEAVIVGITFIVIVILAYSVTR